MPLDSSSIFPLSALSVKGGQSIRHGSNKRHDLTLYDRSNQVVITGEVKMPENPEGRSPYQEGLVMDAHDKANRAGVEGVR